MTTKTLVTYASKGGATQEAAQIISEVLKTNYSLDVEVVDLRKNKQIDFTKTQIKQIQSTLAQEKPASEGKIITIDFSDMFEGESEQEIKEL